MQRKQIYHIIEWTVAIAACGYLVWRLATYEDYSALGAGLQAMGWREYLALVLAVALMPLNMTIEAWRWKTLMNGDASLNGANDANGANDGMMSFKEAQRQVYYSKLAGLITPWRLGEYPARAVLMESERRESRGESQETWSRVLSMGAVGSATMTAVIIACGAIAMITDWRLEIGDWKFSYLIIVAVVLLLLGLALYFAPRLLKRWAEVSHKLVLISLGQSFIRLLCWCVQLALIIWAVDGLGVNGLVDEGISGLGIGGLVAKTFVYYLLVTITPNVPIAEVGVRGAWAIVVFGSMNAALAGVLLWGINTLLPCLFALGISAKRQTSR